MAVLTQEAKVSFDYTVEEIVSLGRYPHQKGLLKQLSKKDLGCNGRGDGTYKYPSL